MCFHRADKQHMAVNIDKAVSLRLKKGPKQTAEPTRPGTRRKLQLLVESVLPDIEDCL